MNLLPTACSALLVLLAAPSAAQVRAGQTGSEATPPITAPIPVRDILVAQPFRLATGYRHGWSKDKPFVTSGTLVVLSVDPALVEPRDTLEPVLYAGDMPVERLNRGHRSGRVVAIVPGEVDVSTLPFWFGPPQLPERVTTESARAERLRAGRPLAPFAPARLRRAARPQVAATDLAALLRDRAAALVLQYAPEDRAIAEAWRLPVARSKSRPPQVK